MKNRKKDDKKQEEKDKKAEEKKKPIKMDDLGDELDFENDISMRKVYYFVLHFMNFRNSSKLVLYALAYTLLHNIYNILCLCIFFFSK